ncbi:MAG TPA: hypothetical protein VK419_08045 [Bryobacteraceae bacterium]|nr:hypothetical protein [Bryobacteraceae bacterium]
MDERSAASVTRALLTRPDLYLLARWNWKSALLSAVVRSALFLRSASVQASGAEFCVALAMAGFLGAFAQAYRQVRPRWLACLMASVMPLGLLHACEFAAHRITGAPARAIAVSIVYSVLSSTVTVFLMRRGIWLAGENQTSLAGDLKKIASLVAVPGRRTFFARNVSS